MTTFAGFTLGILVGVTVASVLWLIWIWRAMRP